tara:strand:- start:21043 stop:22143 length:1101 start_codon:yes stop_codon:yes gene_type:complete
MKNKPEMSVIGIGRLGLCFSLTLEKAGYHVVGYDINESYVESVNNKTFDSFEPGVNEALNKSKNFVATTRPSDILKTRMAFVTVRTDSEPDGKYDVSQVENVVNTLMDLGEMPEQKHLVICSNVNPGYSDTVAARLEPLNWKVSYNPETIAQGTILHNQANPDCVYIGSEEDHLSAEIEEAYVRMCENEPTVHKMSRVSAELTKVSMNCFLSTKIAFANMVGDLANKMGANRDHILQAIGADSRIGNKFFRYGFGFGGPCFPRDTRAFIRCAYENDAYADIVTAANIANTKHLIDMVQTTEKEVPIDEPIRPEYVTYKPGVVILDDSEQLAWAYALAKKGYKVIISDPEEVKRQLKERFGDLFYYE